MISHRSAKPRSALALLTLALIGLAGCGRPAVPAERLPPAPELLTKAADAMAQVRTVAVDVQVDPALSSLPVRSATGKLTAAGEAVGSAVLDQGGPVEFQFAVTKGTLYLKGATGSYQALPMAAVSGIYDPTALLRQDGGVSALLRTAVDGVTEASDAVNGVPAYRVRAVLDRRVVTSVVPGISGAGTGRVWLDKATSRLLKAQVDAPTAPAGGRPDAPTAPVTVTLSDFDAPVTVKPPTGP